MGGFGVAELGVSDGEESGGVFDFVCWEANAGGVFQIARCFSGMVGEEGDPACADGEGDIIGETEDSCFEDGDGLIRRGCLEGGVGGFCVVRSEVLVFRLVCDEIDPCGVCGFEIAEGGVSDGADTEG